MKKDIKNRVHKFKIEIYGGLIRDFTNFTDCSEEEVIQLAIAKAFKNRSTTEVRLGAMVVEEKTLKLKDFNVEGKIKDSQEWKVVGLCRIRQV